MTKRSWIIASFAFLAFLGFSVAAYKVGYSLGAQETKRIDVHYTNAETPANVSADFGLFWQVWDKLRERHFDAKIVTDEQVLYGAIEGLVGAYGDPNTNFFTPEDSKKFSEDINGNFGGIGAEIGEKENQLMVVAPLKNTPAEKAGIMANDKILEINGESTEGLDVNEAVKKIRGEIGTTVTLTMLREEWTEARKIDIVRANIQVPVVEWEMKDGKIAHIKVFSFSGTTTSAFNKAVVDALLGGAEGFVIDLRNDPGGLLEVAVDLGGWFMPRGSVITTEKFSTGEETVFTARGNEALVGIPTVALINGGSASASEILAGAMRINQNIPLIGEKSFGKGTVQQLENLKDGSTLKVTVAHWLLPDGSQIEKNGIMPDHEVKLTEEDVKAERDPQLEKALEVIREKMKAQ